MLYRFSYSSIDFVFVDLCGASYLDLIMSVAGLDCFVKVFCFAHAVEFGFFNVTAVFV